MPKESQNSKRMHHQMRKSQNLDFTLVRTIRKNLISVKGFTLIELLITIAIVGVLSAIVAMNFVNPPKLARDAQRKSELSQYRTALESYANANNGMYPFSQAASYPISAICPGALTDYASSCPADPTSGKWYAYYTYDGSVLGTPTSTKYFLFVAGGLESKPTATWVVCSNGKSGEVSSTDAWDNGYDFCL